MTPGCSRADASVGSKELVERELYSVHGHALGASVASYFSTHLTAAR